MTDKIAIIGLGYVGLPLALEFSKKFDVIGFDINESRVNELVSGFDRTLEVEARDLEQSKKLTFTSLPADICNRNIYIITVPTPIDNSKNPDLSYIEKACKLVGKALKGKEIIIFESTVYPGATEEICVPILENYSELKFNQDFFCGYSPERINPGDKKHRVTNIKKITSGSTPVIADKVDSLYQKIITAGTHKTSSIKIAEAAKVIENTQRDVNIALINEFALLFHKLGIDSQEVLNAAGTKWNFLPFRPGLVGGHCIGVDPYYLTYKASQVGYNPEMILAGRRLNDSMGQYIVDQMIVLMKKNNIQLDTANILIMGLTFKEDCPDYRNTRVIDLFEGLKKHVKNVEVFDPWVNKSEVKLEYNFSPIDKIKDNYYDGIIVAVAHKKFKQLGIKKIRKFGRDKCVIYDVKSMFNITDVDGRL
jgi:UDP-N-acetyl-D-glucosamine/UDP-N-acetyl-D-galactosamine dehydrogenase